MSQNYLSAESNEFSGFSCQTVQVCKYFQLACESTQGTYEKTKLFTLSEASKHIINPVVTHKALLELSKEAAEEGEANREGIFSKFKTSPHNYVEN